MAYITKKKLAEIINNAPNNVDRTKLLSELVKRGNILEGYNEKKTGFLTNVARDIVSPFAKGAELLKTAAPAYGSVIKAGFQQLTGNKEKAQQTLKSAGEKLQQDRQDTIGVFGQGVSTIKNKKQAVGSALEIGSNFIGGAGAKSALTGLKTPLRTVVKDLAVSGAKTGLGAGTLYGAGNALNNDKNVLGGAITGGAGGAIGGAILSPVLGVAGRAVTQTVPAIRTKLLSSSEKRLVNVAQDLTKMTPTAIKKESAWSKNTPKFLVKERVLPLINSENGKIKADDAISALRAKSQLENTAFKNILKDSGKQVSLDEYGNRLKQELTEDLRNRGADLDNAVAKVDKEIEAYKKNYANKITDVDGQSYIDVTDFNDIKSGLWQKSSVSRRVPGSELDADIFYQMGHGAKELIEEVIDDAEVAKLNGRLGDFAQAIKVLETANGKVLPGGMLGKGLTRIAGSIAGAAGGGLPGSIVGNITGGILADIVNNPKTRTTLLSKIYNRLQKEGRFEVIEEAQKILEKRGLERASRKLLEAPKSIILNSKSDTSRLFTQEEAQILLDSYKVKEAPKLLKAPGQNPILLPAKSQSTINKITDKQVMPIKEQVIKATEYNKGDVVNYLGNKYTFDKPYGVSGDSAVITGKDGKQLKVPFTQLKKDGQESEVVTKAKESILKQKSPKVQETKNLFVLHNIYDTNLDKIIEQGSQPAPSIAIVKKDIPYNDFGNITLVGDKGMIDPAIKSNKVFAGDIYSVRTAKPEYKIDKFGWKDKLESKNISKEDSDLVDRYITNFSSYESKENFVDRLKEKIDDKLIKEITDAVYGEPFISVKREVPTGELKTLLNKDRKIKQFYKEAKDFEDFQLQVENDFDTINTLEAIAEKKGLDMYEYTQSLAKDFEEQLPYTNENIVKKMEQSVQQNNDNVRATENWSAPSRVHAFKQFSSISDIKKSAKLLTTKEKAEAEGEKKIDNLLSKADDMGIEVNEDGDGVYQIISKSRYDDINLIKDSFKKFNGSKLTTAEASKFGKLLKDTYGNIKSDYFEAKALREVKLQEWKGALVPEGTPQEKIDSLKKSGLRVVVYKDKEEKANLLKKNFSDLMFGVGGIAVGAKALGENKQ